MDPTGLTMLQKVLVGAGIGLIIGLVPLITGILKRNLKYGLLGLVGSMVGGAALGLLLAIPVAGVFVWLILRGAKTSVEPLPDPSDKISENS
ncbi:MAG: hypothetical protein ABIP78_04580 [Pyrinomonadaceae bacterium]